MPHMIISYAKKLEKDVNLQDLVQTVFNTADETGLFTPDAIKVRALPVDYYVTSGSDKPFVHLDAKLFVGRTNEQKKMMVEMLYESLNALLPAETALSVEAIDMDKETYKKKA